MALKEVNITNIRFTYELVGGVDTLREAVVTGHLVDTDGSEKYTNFAINDPRLGTLPEPAIEPLIRAEIRRIAADRHTEWKAQEASAVTYTEVNQDPALYLGDSKIII